jgi:hypothetical protein
VAISVQNMLRQIHDADGIWKMLNGSLVSDLLLRITQARRSTTQRSRPVRPFSGSNFATKRTSIVGSQ